MGREIRRVIPNWEHPKTKNGDQYQPMFDRTFEEECKKWIEGFESWIDGTHPDFEEYGDKYAYWEWEGNPPDRKYYLPHRTDEEATWYQLYETVSEGTPVSPPFETKKELIDYLVENGDFWCQGRPDERPPTREQATRLVEGGWAPSMIMVHGGPNSGIYNAYEAQDLSNE